MSKLRIKDARKKRTVSVRHPGQPGTKKLLAQYGDRLRSLRYFYDREQCKKGRAVEILLSEEDWVPPPVILKPGTWVGVPIGYYEEDIRAQIKACGGRWDARLKLWFVKYKEIEKLGLARRPITIKESEEPYRT